MSKDNRTGSNALTIDAAGLLVCLGLTGAAYFFGARPVLNAQSRLDEQKQLLEEQARNASDVEGRVLFEQKKLAEVKAKLAATSVPLFPPSDINKRLEVLAQITTGNGLTLRQLDPGAAVSQAGATRFTTVPIRIAGTGSFAGVSGFLHELLAMAYADVEVRGMTLTAGPEGGSESAFEIEMRWYAAPVASAGAATGE
jgi:Tfp pilus assembly protein PilO